QRGAALGGLPDVVNVLRRFGRGSHAVAQKFGAGTDDSQDIVEVVRYSAGEAADSLHFLRLMKLTFGSLLRGDVAGNSGGSHDIAFSVAQGRHGNGNVELASVLGYARRFIMLDAFTARDLAQNVGNFVGAIARREQRYVLADDRFLRGIDNRGEPCAVFSQLLGGSAMQFLVGAAQFLGNALAIADVADCA